MWHLDIALYKAPLEAVHFEPAIGVVFTQHACHKLFGKQEIVEEVDGNVPTLLDCHQASQDGIGVGLRILIRSLNGAQGPFDHQALLPEG